MKIWLCIVCVLGLGVAATFGQGAQADQIKRRARNVADQNNARQGAPPAQPAAPSPAQRPPTFLRPRPPASIWLNRNRNRAGS